MTTEASITQTIDVARLVDRLDLGEPDNRDDLIDLLRERRAFQLGALSLPIGPLGASAAMLRLRATRWAEVEVCEGALTALGVPFDAPGGESDG